MVSKFIFCYFQYMKYFILLLSTFILQSTIAQIEIPYDTLEVKRLTDSVGTNLANGNYLKTLDFSDQALKILGESNQSGTFVRRHKAHTWKRVNNFEEALKLYQVNYNICKQDTGWIVEEFISSMNMGRCFLEMGDLDSAIFYEKLAIANLVFDDFPGLTVAAHSILAEAYALVGDSKNAQKELEFLKFQGTRVPNDSEVIDDFALINIAQVHNLLGEFDSAIVYSRQVLSNNSSEFQKIDASKEIYVSYKNLNVVDSAFKYLQLHFKLKNQTGLERTFNKMLGIANDKRIINDSLQNQIAINKLKTENQAKLELEATRRTYLLLGISISVIFALVALYSYYKKRKSNIIISKQKIEVDKAHHLLTEKNQEILDSINYAKRIQSAILPPQKLLTEHMPNSFILYTPKDVVAGDFYWMEPSANGVYFAAADCTGHGVPGAMVSVICNGGLNRSVREFQLKEPGHILNKTRDLVIQEFEKSEEEVKDGMDIALCYLEGNTLSYAGANNPLWIVRNGEVLETKANKQPIGKYDKNEPFSSHTFELQKGDTVYLFSDGYPDQFGGPKGKKYKSGKFKKFLISIQEHSIENQRELLAEEFESWRGNMEQIDDVCVIGVRI